ncbi:MAG: hypothetical protein BMS9Abin34_227 [Patescibacteria group bacterium]|nr:MAG: hypothetical protein BMS9Abin34_227 [Patescibacteria group bacterium]
MKNPKHEVRNSKQAQNYKSECFKQFGIWEIGEFKFVSDLGFGCWDLSGGEEHG